MDGQSSVSDRLEERSPVEFRFLLYQTGLDMLREKPFFGWPAANIQPELQKRIDGSHPQSLAFHNSFLEVAVAHGMIGLGLYLWLFADLFRLGRRSPGAKSAASHFLDPTFRTLWPVFVAVYALNACFVVMNYQFVNALLFTVAGIFAMQNRAARETECTC
jgi:O-antigen ligase